AIDVSTDYYHPLTNPDRFNGVPGAVLSYISLPFQGRAPIDDPAIRFYRIGGPFAALPAPLFWILVNTAYWLFWLNVMLGATIARIPPVVFRRRTSATTPRRISRIPPELYLLR